MKRYSHLFAFAAVCLFAAPGESSADIVYLTSGRTISVKSHQIDGDSVILTFRSGGQVTADRSIIEKIVPDEAPHPEPLLAAPVAAAAAVAAEVQPPVDSGGILDSTPYGEIIGALSAAHGVDPLLVRALIQVESNYKPKARSPKGAMGLMQLMPSTAREYRVRNPFDPRTNIEAGIKHLKSLIERFGEIELGLAAYNAGEGAVTKFKGVPPYRETRSYVTRILALAGIK